ncbi:MAG TPA: DNA repair protein RecN [Bacteroidales bacterium]|nr:DNA repair protein RecN [Bacteroidales bacterium]
MLKKLQIENYILIDKLRIDFLNGFSVVTGETGAGKSIFLGALSLLLGNRVTGKIHKEKTKKTIIEAIFLIDKFHLETLFTEKDLDYYPETIFRREILQEGKNRCFINDTPVSLATMKNIGSHILDIHTQHDNLWLNKPDFQLTILDVFAETKKIIDSYQTLFSQYLDSKHKLITLEEKATRQQQEKDYLLFQYEQLLKANLQPDEQEYIEKELKLLNHFEEITLFLNQTTAEYYNNDESIISKIEKTKDDLTRISSFYPPAIEWQKRMENISIEINDLISEITAAAVDMSFDPDKQNMLRDRLNLIFSLQQKHKVNSIADLLSIQKSLQKQLEEIDNIDEDINQLKKTIKKQHTKLLAIAEELSEKRKKAIPEIEHKIVKIIKSLGIPNGQFKINLSFSESDFGNKGNDQIQFLFNANKAGELAPVQQVASGGELSRLMLAIKSLLSEKRNLPTIIFDEIDTGVSGAVATSMGKIMRKTANHLQLIAITHSPQIAALGKHHYNVRKSEMQEKIIVSVTLLTEEQRVEEIAKMLSANKITESSISNAKELLQNS